MCFGTGDRLTPALFNEVTIAYKSIRWSLPSFKSLVIFSQLNGIFMIFGLNQFYMIVCNKCRSGISLVDAMTQNKHNDLSNLYHCSCGNDYTYLNGLINDFCSDHFFSAYNFISNIFKTGICTISVGTTYYLRLDEAVPIVNKIFLSPHANVYVEPKIVNDLNSIKIISSEVKDDDQVSKTSIKLGNIVQVDWMLFGRTRDLQVEAWRQLLIQAKEQFIKQNHLLSFFSSAAALEAYINSIISKYLQQKGIPEASIELFLKESTMPDKLFRLLNSLLNISFSEIRTSKKDLEGIISTRNKIAHGKLVSLQRNDASTGFRNVISTIFEIEKQLS